MTMITHHCHKILSHTALGRRAENLGLYSTSCFNAEPSLILSTHQPAWCALWMPRFSSLTTIMKKSAQRDANTARALAVVRFGHRPPARPLAQTYRQDRLQYTAPQLASTQCNNNNRIYITSSRLVRDGYNIRFNFDSTLFDRHTRRAFDCTVTQHGPLTR